MTATSLPEGGGGQEALLDPSSSSGQGRSLTSPRHCSRAMPVLPRGLSNPSRACSPRAAEVEASFPRQGFQLEKDPKSPLTHSLDHCAHPNSLHSHLLCILNDLSSFKSSPTPHPRGRDYSGIRTSIAWEALGP